MWKKITGEDVRSTNIWNSKDPPLASGFCAIRRDILERYIKLRENKQ